MSYTLRLHPEVQQDLLSLKDQSAIDPDWRLRPDEIEPAIRLALELIKSLSDDPFQGEPLTGRARHPHLAGARRLKFDPRSPPPKDRKGNPRKRLRLVWRNRPDDATVEIVSVLTVGHRQKKPYNLAAARDPKQT